MDFVLEVQQTIIEEQLLEQGDNVVVAVSGGPDSTALLHVLNDLTKEWGLQLIVAHVNHQFRGDESDQEAVSVEHMARKLNLPCEIGVINVPEYIQAHSLNTQVAAREKRYDFLFQTAKKVGAKKIAFAHHADDQAETVMMRMIRGVSPSGLTGIPIRRTEHGVEIIRPFLRVYKSQIMGYCDQQAIRYSQDSSNLGLKYTRNQVRIEILPYLQQWNNKLPQALNRLVSLMQDEDDYMEEETKQRFDQIIKREEQAYIFSRQDYISTPIALQRRLIKLILRYLSPTMDAYDYTKVELIRFSVAQTTTPSIELHIKETIYLFKEYDQIRIGNKTVNGQHPWRYTFDHIPSHQAIPEAGVEIRMEEKSISSGELSSLHNKQEFFVDLDQVSLPISVRSRQYGDRLQISGLNGSKKVKDIFIDEKIPPSQRERIPIVVDRHDQVLWIPGLRHSNHASITNQTVRVLHMKCHDFI